MLSKQKFEDKHKVKFQNLTQAQKDARYKSYVTSYKNANPRDGVKANRANNFKNDARNLGMAGGPSPLTYRTLSQCSKKYLAVLANPWLPISDACVPDNITIPSFKVNFFTRATFVVGTAGVGFVNMNPYICFGDNPWIDVTTATYAATDIVPDDSSPAYTTYLNNSPYTTADFQSPNGTLRRRVVAAGIKARYIGPELTRSGRVIEYRQLINDSVFIGGPISIGALMNNRETVSAGVDREWHYALWRPANSTDCFYETDDKLAEACLLIAVQGAPPGASYEFEAIAHFEIIGSRLPNTTKSESDPIGIGVVSSAIANTGSQPTTTPQNTLNTLVKSWKYCY
jgi:hypothetical protein